MEISITNKIIFEMTDNSFHDIFSIILKKTYF